MGTVSDREMEEARERRRLQDAEDLSFAARRARQRRWAAADANPASLRCFYCGRPIVGGQSVQIDLSPREPFSEPAYVHPWCLPHIAER